MKTSAFAARDITKICHNGEVEVPTPRGGSGSRSDEVLLEELKGTVDKSNEVMESQ